MRQCNKCKEFKSADAYSHSVWISPSHYKVICRVCRRQPTFHSVHLKKDGYLYIITNPAWRDWCKIGVTTQEDPNERLKNYHTCSPFRDYEFYAYEYVLNVKLVEEQIHEKLEKELNIEKKNEWFKIHPDQALEILKEHIKEGTELDLETTI